MDFFHSLPVPEFREWIFFIPFPFPNFENGFFPFPSRSQIDPFKVRNQKGKWEILRDASIPTFSASCTFHTQNGKKCMEIMTIKGGGHSGLNQGVRLSYYNFQIPPRTLCRISTDCFAETLVTVSFDHIADSAQTEYCPTFPLSVRPCVTGMTSHISHIYKGINAMLIIRDPSTPIYSESKSSWLSF